MAYSDGDEGIGGWLAFFLVTLGLFSPLSALYGVTTTLADPNLPAAYGPAWSNLVIAEWSLTGLTCLLCWFAAGRFLLVRNWRTVQIGIATLLFLCLANVVIEPLAVSLISGLSFNLLFAQVGVGLFRPFVYTAIWTAYLLNSARVAATYPRGPQGDDLEGVFE